MTTPRSLAAAGVIAMLAMTLAACHNNNGDDEPDPITSPTTAADLAVTLSNTRTCESRLPESTNTLTITDSESPVDLTRIAPDCSNGS